MVDKIGNLDLTLDGALNITFKVPSDIFDTLKFWYFNQSAAGGKGLWEEIPIISLGNGIFTMTVNHTSVFALSLTPPDGQPSNGLPEELPRISFGNYFLIILALSIVSLVIYNKKRKGF